MLYRVHGYLTVSCVADVEASSEEEARTKAAALTYPGLCNQCEDAGGGQGEWQLNGFDDPPDDAVQHIELVEEKS